MLGRTPYSCSEGTVVAPDRSVKAFRYANACDIWMKGPVSAYSCHMTNPCIKLRALLLTYSYPPGRGEGGEEYSRTPPQMHQLEH